VAAFFIWDKIKKLWELLILLGKDLSNWVGVVPFSNLLSIPYPLVGGDGPSYLWELGSFLRLPGKCGIEFFLRPEDVETSRFPICLRSLLNLFIMGGGSSIQNLKG
jgi:hypothetical protein